MKEWLELLRDVRTWLVGGRTLASLERILDSATPVHHKVNSRNLGETQRADAINELLRCFGHEVLPDPTDETRLALPIRSANDLCVATKDLDGYWRDANAIVSPRGVDGSMELVCQWNVAFRRFVSDVEEARAMLTKHTRVIEWLTCGVLGICIWTWVALKLDIKIPLFVLISCSIALISVVVVMRGTAKSRMHFTTRRLLTFAKFAALLAATFFALAVVATIKSRDLRVETVPLPTKTAGSVDISQSSDVVASANLDDDVVRIGIATKIDDLVIDEARFTPHWQRPTLHLDYSVSDSFEASTIRSTKPGLARTGLTSFVTSASCRTLAPRNGRRARVSVDPYIAVTLENLAGDSTGPMTLWLFSKEDRLAIGAQGSPKVELPTISPGGCAVVLVPIDPPDTKLDQGRTPCARLQRGSTTDVACPDSGIVPSPSTLKRIARSSLRNLPDVIDSILRSGFTWNGYAGSESYLRNGDDVTDIFVASNNETSSIPGLRRLSKTPSDIWFRLVSTEPGETGGQLELLAQGQTKVSLDIVVPITRAVGHQTYCRRAIDSAFEDLVQRSSSWTIKVGTQLGHWNRIDDSFVAETGARVVVTSAGRIVKATEFGTSATCEYIGRMESFTHVEGSVRCLGEQKAAQWTGEILGAADTSGSSAKYTVSKTCRF